MTGSRHAPTYTNERVIIRETLLPRSCTYMCTQVVLHMTGISRGRTGLRERLLIILQRREKSGSWPSVKPRDNLQNTTVQHGDAIMILCAEHQQSECLKPPIVIEKRRFTFQKRDLLLAKIFQRQQYIIRERLS